MSLYLPEQKLGSHSVEGGSSNKFILKGRQTGAMHRGHSWVFRAESYDTMMAWYDDIKSLTEKSPQERNAFVRQHARSVSGMSHHRTGSISSDGALDEEDDEPFSAGASGVVTQVPKQDVIFVRPKPGGRFPSDIQLNTARGLLAAQDPLSQSSGSSGNGDIDTQDRDIIAAAADLPGSGIGEHYKRYGHNVGNEELSHVSQLNRYAQEDGINPYTNERVKGTEPGHGPVVKSNFSLGARVSGAEEAKAYRDSQAISAPETVSHVGDNVPPSDQTFIELTEVVAPGSSKQPAAEDSSVAKIAHASAVQSNNDSLETANANHSIYVSSTNGTSMTSGSTDLGSPTNAPLATVPRSQNRQETLSDKSDMVLQSEGKVGQGGEPMRPRAEQHHKSISELHVPGEYPKAETAVTTFN